ncbi:cupin domain-containing protein [Nocardioides sp.]|uniref:cupin domain-containing protein n=1 Tax=Nocardioides sp. TaxID=35761 RepID=UPI002ED657A8
MPVVGLDRVELARLPGRLSADPVPSGLGEDYAVRVVRVPAGPRTPHLHPHSDEVTYVVSGSGNAWEGDRCTPVGAGDLIIVPRGTAHATVATGHEDLVLLCFFPRPDLAENLVELDAPLRT